MLRTCIHFVLIRSGRHISLKRCARIPIVDCYKQMRSGRQAAGHGRRQLSARPISGLRRYIEFREQRGCVSSSTPAAKLNDWRSRAQAEDNRTVRSRQTRGWLSAMQATAGRRTISGLTSQTEWINGHSRSNPLHRCVTRWCRTVPSSRTTCTN